MPDTTSFAEWCGANAQDVFTHAVDLRAAVDAGTGTVGPFTVTTMGDDVHVEAAGGGLRLLGRRARQAFLLHLDTQYQADQAK